MTMRHDISRVRRPYFRAAARVPLDTIARQFGGPILYTARDAKIAS